MKTDAIDIECDPDEYPELNWHQLLDLRVRNLIAVELLKYDVTPVRNTEVTLDEYGADYVPEAVSCDCGLWRLRLARRCNTSGLELTYFFTPRR